MKTRKAKWTRGPGHALSRNRTRNGVETFDLMAGPGKPENWDIVADRIDGEGNAALLEAAITSATALEDQGYDGLEAIKALPEIVEALRDLLGSGGSDNNGYGNCRHCGRDFESEQLYCVSDDCPGFQVHALLARITEEK